MPKQPLYLTKLAEENCEFIDSVDTFDIWMTPTNELILQQSARESDYACIPYTLAKRTRLPHYVAAVAVVELHSSKKALT